MTSYNSKVTGGNLEQRKWDNMLRRAVEAEDIMSQFRGDIKGNGVLPGSIIVVAKQSGQTSKVLGLVRSLSGSGKQGYDALSGSEEKLIIDDFTAYANEFKHGVNVDKWGYDAVANKPYGVLEIAVPLLGEYMEKYKGTHRREALNQRLSSNLTVAPVSKAQHINSNVFVGGVALSLQPSYSDTLATYAAAINTAIPDAPTSANKMNLAGIKQLEKFTLVNKRIKPIKALGDKYVVTVPTNAKYDLMDEDNGIGKLTIQTENKYNLKNWIGEWGRFIFVEDMRSSVLTATDGGSSTLVWSYTTVDDSRPTTGADKWDVAYVLGSDAVLELELEALHLENDDKVEYGREKRTGAFANYGDQLIEWSRGTDSIVNYGSIVALFASEV